MFNKFICWVLDRIVYGISQNLFLFVISILSKGGKIEYMKTYYVKFF